MNPLLDFLFRVGIPALLNGEQDGGDVHDGALVWKSSGGSIDDRIAAVPVRYCWCLDAGHGRLTRGKRSPWIGSLTIVERAERLMEWQFNRDIVERIIEQLSAYGRAYMRTMPEHGEYGNALTQRVNNANNHATEYDKVFVSVHGNAGPADSVDHYTDDTAKGIETWYYHRSTSSRKMAGIFQKHLVAETGMVNRHLRSKSSGQFYVLRATRMTAILTENGFFNNRFDLMEMIKPSFRQKVADAHVAAIMEIEKNGL